LRTKEAIGFGLLLYGYLADLRPDMEAIARSRSFGAFVISGREK
jgi:hypothetical protein